MPRFAYVNGRYLPHAEAVVHVEDRGYQFSDGIYEVIAVRRGAPVDFAPHFDRLCDGLAGLRIDLPMSRAALVTVLRTLLRKNRLTDGILYLQVTRGVATRNHLFPAAGKVRPAVVATCRFGVGPSLAQIHDGVRVIATEDLRWRRRDLKTVSLLPNVMAKQAAAEAGAFEAFLTAPDGTVTEAGASNAWIVEADGTVVTRPLSEDILPGVTRRVVIDLARADGVRVDERPFTLEEAKAAREVFITSTTSFVLPVIEVDGRVIGNGAPGSVATRLRGLYEARIAALDPAEAWA